VNLLPAGIPACQSFAEKAASDGTQADLCPFLNLFQSSIRRLKIELNSPNSPAPIANYKKSHFPDPMEFQARSILPAVVTRL
jgi:hypothetical protein